MQPDTGAVPAGDAAPPYLLLTTPQAANVGAYKTQLPWWKIVLLGAVAGCYVGLGGALLLTGEGAGRGCQGGAVPGERICV